MAHYTVELEVTPGLEQFALSELVDRYGERLRSEPEIEPGIVRFQYAGNLGGLLALETIIAAYLLETYDIPRPKAFLGHQHLTRLLEQIEIARDLSPREAYTTIHINAAGSTSSVMKRLLNELASSTQLTADFDEGDLLLRLRPATQGTGWDVLVRLSPRPNATRDWRVENLPGALNASVAHVMAWSSEPSPDDVVVNVAAGSATLAIERLRLMDAQQVIVCDTSAEALSAARTNIETAGLSERIQVRDWNATDLPLSPGFADVVLADLPFGNLTGSHQENVKLYPVLLKEAARITKKGGRFVLITHEVRLMEAVIRDSDKWQIRQLHHITLSGLHPRIYVLLRI